MNEETGQVEFKCQHGPDECFGNKVQGCVLSKLADQDSQVNYVSCQMRPAAARDHQQCVVEAGLSWEEIYECSQSDFATQQQQHFEQVSSPIIVSVNYHTQSSVFKIFVLFLLQGYNKLGSKHNLQRPIQSWISKYF